MTVHTDTDRKPRRASPITDELKLIARRRAAEDNKLANMLDQTRREIARLTKREAEIVALLAAAPPAPTPVNADVFDVKLNDDAPQVAASKSKTVVQCMDCNGWVKLSAPGVLPAECPQCAAGPFEVKVPQ